jgi:hypothetical protein
MRRNVIKSDLFHETDMSLTKSWKFGERMTAQLSGKFFNIFYAVEYAVPAGKWAAPSTFGRASPALPLFPPAGPLQR